MVAEDQFIPFQASSLPAGPWVVFAPHPDDETFGMGGSIRLAVQHGITVIVVILTDGARGEDTASSSLVHRREEEAKKATSFLGVGELVFWQQEDRKLESGEHVIRKVQALVEEKDPAAVFFPSFVEPHPDHRATTEIVWHGLRRCENFKGEVYAYEISVQGPVNKFIDISKVRGDKARAMSFYTSQIQENNYEEVITSLDKSRTFSLPSTVTCAEGFWHFDWQGNKSLPVQIIEAMSPYWQHATSDALPLVSVIVRTKDRPELLRQALESVVLQTYQNIELIVVNDGGEDVGHIVSDFHDLVARLKYVALKSNRGRAVAANTGLEYVGGQYISFLDDDDLLDPDHISALVGFISQESRARVAYAGVRVLDEGKESYLNSTYDSSLFRFHNNFPIHSVMFHRSLLDGGCRFDENLRVFEDWDFWLQVAEVEDFHHLDRISATYRDEGTSCVGLSPDSFAVAEGRAILFDKWKGRWSGKTLDLSVSALTERGERYLRKLEDLGGLLHGTELHLHEIELRLHETELRLHAKESLLNIMLASKSWRLTLPLRMVSAFMLKCRGLFS